MSYDADCYCEDLVDGDGEELCVFCDMELSWALNMLAKNILAASMMCKAWALGYLSCRQYDAGVNAWAPGCGRAHDDTSEP